MRDPALTWQGSALSWLHLHLSLGSCSRELHPAPALDTSWSWEVPGKGFFYRQQLQLASSSDKEAPV